MRTRVHALRAEASAILGIELRAVDATSLPPFEAGAHVDLHLPNGLVRSYSLVNTPGEVHRYQLAVLKEGGSRGGSRWVHENLHVGMELEISAPRNNFPLDLGADHSVLMAGGIGITPILCMARALRDRGRSFEILYSARARGSAAFVAEIEQLGVRWNWHFDEEAGGPPDLMALLGARPASDGTHYYACGPAALLDGFVHCCAELGHKHAHIERFSAVDAAPAADARRSYMVTLAQSRKVVAVEPGKTLLRALVDAGVDVPFSCEEGTCGTCETRVIDGLPDHRDSVLSAAERAANRTMMICVSGCRSERLVLDL